MSLFFKIPLEIREMIYVELIGCGRVWIILKNDKLACLREEQRIVSPRRGHAVRPGMQVLPFLQTCRRVYSEAIDLLYSTPTFAFDKTRAFLAFSASALPARSQKLRSLNFNSSGEGVPGHIVEASPGPDLRNPHLHELNYSYLNNRYRGTLYNAAILRPRNKNPLLPTYMWDAVADALEEMKGLRDVFISLSNVKRQILVWVEHGYENSGQRDACEIRQSLEWVGRDRPWKGEGKSDEQKEKQIETKIVFENVWKRPEGEWTRGHWVRQIDNAGEVKWREVGEAAGPREETFEY